MRSRSLKGQTLLSRTSEHSTWNWIGGVEWGMTAETMPDDDLPRSRCRSRSSQGASEQFIFIHICIYLTRRCGWGCAWWCCRWRRCDDDLQLNESRICGLYALTFPPLIHTFIHTFVYERPSLDVLWDARWPCKWSFDSLIGDQRSIIVWMPGCSGFWWWSRGPRTGEWICDSRTKANDVLIASVFGRRRIWRKRQPKRQDVDSHSIQRLWVKSLDFYADDAGLCCRFGCQLLLFWLSALGFVARWSFVKGQMQIEGCNFCYNLFSPLCSGWDLSECSFRYNSILLKLSF